MKASNFAKVIVGVAIAAIIGFAATSYAGWGRGGGRGAGNCWGQGTGFSPGAGMVPRGYGAPGFQGSLSNEQIDKLNKQQQAFFEENRTVREKLYQKQLELRSELAKKDPDAQKTAALQTEISNFQSQLAQKRIEQQIKMKKDFPELADRGYRSGTPGYSRRGMAPGYGSQGMMGPGYGPRGMSPGYGPQGMMAPGYGPRGMSPGYGPQGMMGSGYGHRDMGSGYGPQGMMGPGYGSRGKGAGYGRGGAGWN